MQLQHGNYFGVSVLIKNYQFAHQSTPPSFRLNINLLFISIQFLSGNLPFHPAAAFAIPIRIRVFLSRFRLCFGQLCSMCLRGKLLCTSAVIYTSFLISFWPIWFVWTLPCGVRLLRGCCCCAAKPLRAVRAFKNPMRQHRKQF